MRLKSKTSTRLYQKTINRYDWKYLSFLYLLLPMMVLFVSFCFSDMAFILHCTYVSIPVSSSSNLVIICVSVCVFCDLSSCQLVDYIILLNFLDLSSDLHLSSRDYINLNVIISCVLLNVIHWVFQVLNLLFQILVFPGNVGTTFCKLVNSRSSTEGQFLQHWFQMKAKELVVSMCQFLWWHCH